MYTIYRESEEIENVIAEKCGGLANQITFISQRNPTVFNLPIKWDFRCLIKLFCCVGLLLLIVVMYPHEKYEIVLSSTYLTDKLANGVTTAIKAHCNIYRVHVLVAVFTLWAAGCNKLYCVWKLGYFRVRASQRKLKGTAWIIYRLTNGHSVKIISQDERSLFVFEVLRFCKFS